MGVFPDGTPASQDAGRRRSSVFSGEDSITTPATVRCVAMKAVSAPPCECPAITMEP
jgi:hypothetical protein